MRICDNDTQNKNECNSKNKENEENNSNTKKSCLDNNENNIKKQENQKDNNNNNKENQKDNNNNKENNNSKDDINANKDSKKKKMNINKEKKEKEIPYFIHIQTTSKDLPWYVQDNENIYKYFTLNEAIENGIWNYPLTEKDKQKYMIFCDIWEKKENYYITSGSKYGTDYLIYPGINNNSLQIFNYNILNMTLNCY